MRSQEHDVFEVEQIIMILGLETTLNKISAKPLVKEILDRDNMTALVYLLKTAHRANIACSYAFDWAVRLHDYTLKKFVSLLYCTIFLKY
jgi:hypothetical protein